MSDTAAVQLVDTIWRFKPYPAYKPSGVEWLGDIPVQWELPPLYTRYSIELGKMLDESKIAGDYLVPYLRNVDVQWNRINFDDLPEMDIVPRDYERYTVKVGDLLVCEGGEVGRCAIVPRTEKVYGYQKALHRLRPLSGGDVPRFMYYTLMCASSFGAFIAEGNPNTIPHLTGENLRRYRFPKPPIAEQRAIADYLDREAAKTDTLISKKRELIQKLKEKRSALISRTVTRGLPPDAASAAGLDPHPPRKPSGIDWLGDVPAHWEVNPILRLATAIQTGPFGSQLHESDYVEGGIPLINPAHIIENRLVPENHSTVDQETAARLSRHQLRAGDIIVGRRGEIGRCSVVTSKEEGWICGTGSLVIRLEEDNPNYFAKVISSIGFSSLLELNAVGTTMLNLSPSIIGRMCVPAPPPSEQSAISDYLDYKTAQIEGMAAKIEAAIERLQEYRAVLITAAVSGKIDVRGTVDAN
jgi:type I restriction enzyme S subunit